MDTIKFLTELFRAISRPAISIIFAAVIAQVVVEGIQAPTWFIGMAVTVIGWWFVDRSVMHIREQSAAIQKEIINKLTKGSDQ